MINAYGYSMAKYLKRQSHNETLLSMSLTILYSNRTNEAKKAEKDLIEFSVKGDKRNKVSYIDLNFSLKRNKTALGFVN